MTGGQQITCAADEVNTLLAPAGQTCASFLDAFVARDARIQFNGKHISREQYKTTIRGEIFDEAGASVTFNSVVSVQDPNSELVRYISYPISPSFL